jgi:hypothetical protein
MPERGAELLVAAGNSRNEGFAKGQHYLVDGARQPTLQG